MAKKKTVRLYVKIPGGRVNTRVSPELQGRIGAAAKAEGLSVKAWCLAALSLRAGVPVNAVSADALQDAAKKRHLSVSAFVRQTVHRKLQGVKQ